jgi:hypothetical protein
MRAMIMRRIRTLTDQFLQPLPAPGTPESDLYVERRLNEQSSLIDPPSIVPSDARLDFEKWGPGSRAAPRYVTPTRAVAVKQWRRQFSAGKPSICPGAEATYNTQIVGRAERFPAPNRRRAEHEYTPLVAQGRRRKVLEPTNNSLGQPWTEIHPSSLSTPPPG